MLKQEIGEAAFVTGEVLVYGGDGNGAVFPGQQNLFDEMTTFPAGDHDDPPADNNDDDESPSHLHRNLAGTVGRPLTGAGLPGTSRPARARSGQTHGLRHK